MSWLCGSGNPDVVESTQRNVNSFQHPGRGDSLPPASESIEKRISKLNAKTRRLSNASRIIEARKRRLDAQAQAVLRDDDISENPGDS